jgi:hypothetical protein
MSASTTEATQQPVATSSQLSSGTVNFAGFNQQGQFLQIPASVFSEALGLPVVQLTATTGSATPMPVPDMPAIPTSGGFCVLQGQVIAQSQSDWSLAVWNIALAVFRQGTATSCTVQGDDTPGPFTISESMLPCLVTLGADSSGPTIIIQGPSGVDVAWSINLSYTVGPQAT